MHVVATAGHVDHGKSTLLRALTTMEPDRWAEERARGLTIDLGFVWTELGEAEDRRTVAFVDVPGHQRFIANMLAGAGAVRLALFVVAADDGWSAQSQEHLDILDLLGVSAAVVAITKSELAGEERALEVAADVEHRLGATALSGAPIVLTDAVAGRGLDELTATLVARLAETPPVDDVRRARLWVDRSFTISGAGTVVTGTLDGGSLSVGEEVVLLPEGRTARIRGLQALGEAHDRVRPGSRVAVNLAGVEQDDVDRGDALVTGAADPATAWVVTDTLDTYVRALEGEDVDRAGAWHLHVGSAEVVCTVHPLLGEPVEPGRPGYVRVLLERPLPLQVGDRFVLREAGRRTTAGGGVVVDPEPPGRVRGVDRRLTRAERLDAVRDADDASERVVALVAGWDGARPAARTLAAAGRRPDEQLDADGLARVGRWLVHDGARAGWHAAIETATRAHHEAAPTERGPDRTALVDAATAAGCPTEELAAALLEHLVSDGRLRRHGSTYALPEHAPAVDEARERRVEDLLARLGADPLAPPKLADAAREAGLDYQEVQRLEQSGRIVRCGPIAFLPTAVEDAVARLRALQADAGPFTAAQAKDAWGTTRKYAIPLLEHLDAVGVTRFDGQHRTLAG